MKQKLTWISMVLIVLFIMGSGQAEASMITFDNIGFGTIDPLVSSPDGDVQFSAGSGSDRRGDPRSTGITSLVSDNEVLSSGKYDGSVSYLNSIYVIDRTFVKIEAMDSLIFNTIAFDIADVSGDNRNGSIVLLFYLNGVQVMSQDENIEPWNEGGISLGYNIPGGVDTLYMIGELDRYNFVIDNFEFTPLKAPQVPEPTTIILFGFGLLGLTGLNRRKE